MMETRLYLYDSSQEANQYRGKDYSKYLLLGDSDTDTLNEELDVVNLTLVGLKEGKEFAPTTMFILEKWVVSEESENLYKDWHLVVTNDVVSQPIISDNNYFQHSITLMELAVIAQQRIVDNISVTYKLKDVTLTGIERVDPSELAKLSEINIARTYDSVFVDNYNTGNNLVKTCLGKKYEWEISETDRKVWEDLQYYQDLAGAEKEVTLFVPKLKISRSLTGTKNYGPQGYCSVQVIVEELDEYDTSNELINKIITPSKADEQNWRSDVIPSYGQQGNVPKGYIWQRTEYKTGYSTSPEFYIKKVAEFNDSTSNRTISFKIKSNYRYFVRCNVANYENGADFNLGSNFFVYSDNSTPPMYYSVQYQQGFPNVTAINNPPKVTTMQLPLFGTGFIAYDSTKNTIKYFRSAPPVSAYELFQKCQIANQQVEKIDGINILDTPQTFYLDDEDKQRLLNTTIVENFYNQKNLWEMFIEIGKYIHSIPYIRFGKDNRFVVKWKQLGDTQQQVDSANKITIFNSRSIENYICAVSSYVSNAVQLGGVVDEWVAPKSNSEDYLVYNDVAEIVTSKPIIEIVDMEVKCISNRSGNLSGVVGQVRNLVGKNEDLGSNGYVFEESIYNLLSVDWKTAWEYSVNKGYAIYYTLGTNVIKGLNYRLPTKNAGATQNDYAIKNILANVFNVTSNPQNIKINDFVFHIIYRTKDELRSNQSRPDLRKYLLNSKYDTIPQHNQFNNQQDVLVDSVKFGNNVYGKLIRTGNTEYRVTEWCSSLFQIKQSGQLVNIFGNLYYVSKVENTYFNDHIISEVTYSKDYNQLSEIIGIPSEPRFYEISERSIIDREVAFNQYLMIGKTYNPMYDISKQQFKANGWAWILNLLLGPKKVSSYPRYAITTFKNDINRKYGSVVGNELFYKDICTPVNTYSMQNTLSIEWDMVDNFSAGDKIMPTKEKDSPYVYGKQVDGAFYKLVPVKYTDVFGRSDLVDVAILGNIPLKAEDIQNLPESPISTFKYYKEYLSSGVYVGKPDITEKKFIDYVLNIVKTQATNLVVGDLYCVGVICRVNNVADLYYFKVKYTAVDTISIERGQMPIDRSAVSISTRSFDKMDNKHGIGLVMDNREVFRGNYNIQAISDSDRYVFSSYFWKPKQEVKFAVLGNEVNKLSHETIPSSYIIKTLDIYEQDGVPSTGGIKKRYVEYIKKDGTNYAIQINVDNLLADIGVPLDKIKAIAFIDTAPVNGIIESGSSYFVLAKNVTDLGEEKKDKWYISNLDKAIFSKENGNYQ